jgi:hypothetical protein
MNGDENEYFSARPSPLAGPGPIRDNADAPPDRASRARLDEIGRFSRGQMDKTVPLESLLERLVM